jgi:hypothetical protein
MCWSVGSPSRCGSTHRQANRGSLWPSGGSSALLPPHRVRRLAGALRSSAGVGIACFRRASAASACPVAHPATPGRGRPGEGTPPGPAGGAPRAGPAPAGGRRPPSPARGCPTLRCRGSAAPAGPGGRPGCAPPGALAPGPAVPGSRPGVGGEKRPAVRPGLLQGGGPGRTGTWRSGGSPGPACRTRGRGSAPGPAAGAAGPPARRPARAARPGRARRHPGRRLPAWPGPRRPRPRWAVGFGGSPPRPGPAPPGGPDAAPLGGVPGPRRGVGGRAAPAAGVRAGQPPARVPPSVGSQVFQPSGAIRAGPLPGAAIAAPECGGRPVHTGRGVVVGGRRGHADRPEHPLDLPGLRQFPVDVPGRSPGRGGAVSSSCRARSSASRSAVRAWASRAVRSKGTPERPSQASAGRQRRSMPATRWRSADCTLAASVWKSGDRTVASAAA